MANYVCYHLHSDLSNGVTSIDSVTKPDQYIQRAKECGMTALAFSEHGSVFSWVKKKERIEAAGMKYIHAEEFYVTKTINEKIRDNKHLIMIAANYNGVLELNELSSKSFNRNDNHYYYVPRITIDDVINTSDNIIITSACLGGILPHGDDEIRKMFIRFMIKNKHRCFLEIQHHNVQEQIKYNQYLYKISQKYDIPLIAGTDTHALNKEHLEARAILQKAKNIHFSEEDAWDLEFKTYDELLLAYEKQNSLPINIVKEAIQNTNLMANMIEEFTLDKSYKYPHLWENSEKVFMDKIYKGIFIRGVDKYKNYPEYIERIDYELKAYKHNGAIDFMLLMEDIVSWCRTQDIQIGYGRGSVNGSVIAWLLGITEMDSIKYKLNFDRFMNIERVSLSDIDTDFPPSRIEDVKQYIFHKHGLYCCDIVTFNTIADKGAIRDVGRALKIPLDEVNKICKTVDNEEQYKQSKEAYSELFKYVALVKGVIVSVGNHPCGTVVSPLTLTDHMGLFSTTTDSYPISQIYMKEIDGLNYLKLDLLKLDTIELIANCCKMANISMLTPDNMDITDVDVWNSMRDDTTQIFQWEGTTGENYIKKLLSDENIKKFQAVDENVDRMTLLSIGNSAIRPAGASYREDLAHGIIRKSGSDAIDEFLKPTFGYLVFQCQIIEFLHSYCGFTMGEADIVRRCVDENSLITMANGKRKPIKDINIGDIVMTLDEEAGAFTYNKVNNKYDNGYQNTIEIKTQHEHCLRLTKQHKILTQRGWINAGELTTEDYIMIPLRNHGYSDNKKPSERLSQTDMFLIGILIGDGTIGGDISELRFTNSDMILIEKFKECVNNRLKNPIPCEFGFCIHEGIEVDKVYSVRIISSNYKQSVWNSLIIKMGLNCKATKKHIPNELMNYPCGDKLSSLLGGLFSTDGGYVEASKSIEYYSISKELVYDIQFLLGKYGIYSYVYSGNVKKYNYKSYKLRISQKDSINVFKETIIPFIIGKKHDEFLNICIEREEKTSTSIRYNYLLPKNYFEEIRKNAEKQNISLLSMGFLSSAKNYNSFTDIKIKKTIQFIYAPSTYKLLMSEYMPVKINEIHDVGISHVYDLEIENNHNYIAEGLIVHNCFAKKLGTEDWIPIIKNGGYPIGKDKKHYIPGFITTMKEKYGMSKEESEKTIIAFLQVIEAASEYLFSLNHSQPYSFEGYACAWLRYYYPVEFLTCALNINKDKEDKTIAITNYAKKIGITLKDIKFGYSHADYSGNPKNKTIYKGLSSIKFMSEQMSEELYNLSDKKYNSLVDLLDAIVTTSCNSRQLDILIKLDYFSEFGDINFLLKAVKYYDILRNIKQIKHEKLALVGLKSKDVEPFAEKVLAKTIKIKDAKSLLEYAISQIKEPKTTTLEKMRYQNELLGYVSIIDPNLDDNCYFVQNISGTYSRMVSLYQMNSGKSLTIKIRKSQFEKNPVEIGQITRIKETINDRKWRLLKDEESEKEYWVQIDEREDILTKYSVIS